MLQNVKFSPNFIMQGQHISCQNYFINISLLQILHILRLQITCNLQFAKSSTFPNNLVITILQARFIAICWGVNLIGYFRIYKEVRQKICQSLFILYQTRFNRSGKLHANQLIFQLFCGFRIYSRFKLLKKNFLRKRCSSDVRNKRR